MLSLGQGVFFGLGGYAMAMYLKLDAADGVLPDFMTWSGLHELPWFWKPFEHAWFAMPIAVIGPGILAFLLGYLVFRSRVKGVYFSIITQALALILSTFFVGQQPYTGGTNGMTNFTTLFGKLPDRDRHAAPALLRHRRRAAGHLPGRLRGSRARASAACWSPCATTRTACASPATTWR